MITCTLLDELSRFGSTNRMMLLAHGARRSCSDWRAGLVKGESS